MFNRTLLFRKINKNSNYILKSDFLNFVREDIVERILLLNRNFDKVITIRDHGNIISNILSDKFYIKEIVQIEDEEVLINDLVKFQQEFKKFNLIIFPFGLHFTNNVQGFLFACFNLLEEDGLLMCNFASSDSLSNLRKYFISTEMKLSLPHSYHIAPLIKFSDVAMLLKQAGFKESIVDIEKIELEFATPLDLIRAIKKAGCSNVSINTKGYNITKGVFAELGIKYSANSLSELSEIYQDIPFIDHINLTSFIASPNRKSLKMYTS